MEPFAGSACLFFSVEPAVALLGDVNAELVSAYRTLRRSAKAVHSTLGGWSDDQEEYYRVRALDVKTLSREERAARFIYLNRLCFNGLYRTNQQGHFNVPYGGSRVRTPHSLEALQNAGRVLRKAELVADDFDQVLERVEPGDFVFMDPPYRVANRRVFREYHAGEFSEGDLARLREWLERLDEARVRFVVTYADSPEGRNLGRGFVTSRIRVRRNIAGFAGSRRDAYELLISST